MQWIINWSLIANVFYWKCKALYTSDNSEITHLIDKKPKNSSEDSITLVFVLSEVVHKKIFYALLHLEFNRKFSNKFNRNSSIGIHVK